MSSKQGKLRISWHSRRVCTQFIKEYHHVYLVEGKKEGTRTWACCIHLGSAAAVSRVCSYTLWCVDKRMGGLGQDPQLAHQKSGPMETGETLGWVVRSLEL